MMRIYIGVVVAQALLLQQSGVVLGQTPAPAPVYWPPSIIEILPPIILVPRSVSPTIAPTDITVAPVPVEVPVDTVPQTGSPVIAPPSATVAPTTIVPAPTVTVAPQTTAPVPTVTAAPTTIAPAPVAPTTTTVPVPTVPVPTVVPTIAPAVVPVPATDVSPVIETEPTTPAPFIPTPISETVQGIYLVYPNVSHNTFVNDTEFQIASITTAWFLNYFTRLIDISNMTTMITITKSGPIVDTNDTYILYDQTLEYVQVHADALDPENYTLLPFKNKPQVEKYINALQMRIPKVFSELSSIDTPVIGGTPPVANTTNVPTEAPSKKPEDWALAVIILGTLAGVGILIYAASEISKKQAPKAYSSPYEPTLIKSSTDGAGSSAARSVIQQVETGLFVVYAPTGKLGFSLDQPDSGPLIIFVVKDDSPLRDQIQNGDRLVSVDELNVRKSSPTRVVGLLKERAANPYRKLTFIRHDETQTINDVEGQYVVYAPPEKLGFSLDKASDNEPPTVRVLKPTSLLVDTVEVGDQLLSIDEVDTKELSAQESVKVLKDRSTNPFRKLTFLRVMPTETPYDDGEMKSNEDDDEGYVIAFAPAGGLGFSLESPDATSMLVHSIKPTSPLLHQVKTGDRLIGVDDVDVRTLSPARVVNLLSTRKTNVARKLTLLRRGSNVTVSDASITLETGTFVIYVPPTKLGFSLFTPDDNGAPEFQVIKEESLLFDSIKVGDRLLRVDEIDTTAMHAGKVVKILNARRENPFRKLVIQRGDGQASSSVGPSVSAFATSVTSASIGETYTVKAPAGKLGVILDNPDDGAPVIHTVKDTSPLLGQISVGDRLVKIDDVDVSAFSPAQVVQLLSTKSNNPVRLLTMAREPSGGSTEPEINLNDGESTVTGGEYIEETDADTNDGDNK